MQRFFIALIYIFSMSLSPVFIAAKTESPYTVILTKASDNDQPNLPHPNDDPRGNRIPPRPINCSISPDNGIDISSISLTEITSFELYDMNGDCIGIFIDPNDFISCLFSQNSDIELRFHIDNYILHGYLSI